MSEELSLLARIEGHAARTPNAVAVVCGGEHLSYAELDQRGDRLAATLIEHGVGPEVVVGLEVGRSKEAVIGLVAIWKAGGAYLPLDTGLPPARRNKILSQSGVSVVIDGGGRVRESPPISAPAPISAVPNVRAEGVRKAVSPASLAYVIFTSGSTGRPKGVAVEHRHVAAYVHGATERLELAEVETFAMMTPLAFDLGYTALFCGLARGGTVHLISEECSSDARKLEEYFEKHPCDLLKVTPLHLSALLADAQRPRLLVPRRRLVLGGERLSWGALEVLRSLAAPECRIFNHYGPSETTVGVIAGEVGGLTVQRRSATVPLGLPMSHARIHLLDDSGEPVPVGTEGNIHVGGQSVARGYFRDGDQTARSFMPDRCSTTPGSCLYATGDRARILGDGSFEFLGRRDRQIKLRGFRIELGEIEAALLRRKEVKEAVVVSAGESVDQHLNAYVVLGAPSESADTESLRAYLASELPAPMVPARIVALPRLPLSANGKLDSSALPVRAREVTAREEEEPRSVETATEQAVAELFATLLGTARVGKGDDFFSIGGHSLLAIRLLARLRSRFNVDVTLRQVFESSTVAALSRVVDAAPQLMGRGA